MNVEDAAVVLHLHIRVNTENLLAFKSYVEEAFPVFEAASDCQGMVYACTDDPECLDEVFYYKTAEDYEQAERALTEDPRQKALIAKWRSLLEGPPRVEVCRRLAK